MFITDVRRFTHTLSFHLKSSMKLMLSLHYRAIYLLRLIIFNSARDTENHHRLRSQKVQPVVQQAFFNDSIYCLKNYVRYQSHHPIMKWNGLQILSSEMRNTVKAPAFLVPAAQIPHSLLPNRRVLQKGDNSGI